MKKKVVILGILLICACIALMLIPKSDITSNTANNGEAQIVEPSVPEQDPIITEEGAIKIVTDRLHKSTAADIMTFSQEYGEGGWTYEGTIKSGKAGVLYAFQIDADMGTLLQWEPVKEDKK